MPPTRVVRFLAAVICFMIAAGEFVAAQDSSVANISELIEQLGAESYDAREDAREQIVGFGQTAFDVLYAAREHRDLETRLAVESLLQQIAIRWTDNDNSEEAQKIMKDFGSATMVAKRSIMSRLELLETEETTKLLSRIVRFEADERISKRAALNLMELDSIRKLKTPEQNQILRVVFDSVQASPRPASKWLSVWADANQSQEKPNVDTAERKWSQLEELIAVEFELQQLYPRTKLVSRELVKDLLIWQASNTLNRNQQDKAIDQFREFLTMLNGDLAEIASTIEWLEKHQAWLFVVETHLRHSAMFEQIPALLYSAALAHRQLGDEAKTNELVAVALKADASAFLRIRIASSLESRGHKEWAKGEYEKVIEITEITDEIHTSARSLYAEMVFDMGDPEQAAAILRPTVEAMLKEDHVSGQIRGNYESSIESVISRHYYYVSKAEQRSGEYGKAARALAKGLDHDPNDVDALITLFKISEFDTELRKKALDRLRATVGKFRDEIRGKQQALIESGGEDPEYEVNIQKWELAKANNQLAWLVCNTTGDFQEAIRSSHRSLDLLPDTASYLDTLAHCYYAVEDFENAVKYQKRAAELEPHVEIIQQKLKLFSDALQQGRKIPERD